MAKSKDNIYKSKLMSFKMVNNILYTKKYLKSSRIQFKALLIQIIDFNTINCFDLLEMS